MAGGLAPARAVVGRLVDGAAWAIHWGVLEPRRTLRIPGGRIQGARPRRITRQVHRASVRVDVNQAWDEAVALRACKVLGDHGIDLIEQPISRNNRGGMARLNLSSPVPIMAAPPSPRLK